MNDAPEPMIGEIEAYRAFEIENGMLTSVGLGEYVWTPGTNRARCHLAGKQRDGSRTVWVNDPDDPAGLVQREEAILSAYGRIPSPSCSCGFYVFKYETSCRGQFGQHSDAIARVRLWGRAIEYDDGYRVEFARIAALITDRPEDFSSVLDRYDIGFEPPRTKAEEGITTAYLIQVEGRKVKLDVPVRDSEEVIGWFTLATGVGVPEPVVRVIARFTTDRVITEIRLEDDDR